MLKNIDSKWIEFRLWLKITIIIISIIISCTLFYPFDKYLNDIVSSPIMLSPFIDIVLPVLLIGLCLFIIILMIELIFWLLEKLKK